MATGRAPSGGLQVAEEGEQGLSDGDAQLLVAKGHVQILLGLEQPRLPRLLLGSGQRRAEESTEDIGVRRRKVGQILGLGVVKQRLVSVSVAVVMASAAVVSV